jgi:ATP-dependent DNA ligase
VPLFFPQPTSSLSHPHTDTLLDGELVIDRERGPGGGVIDTPRFLAFDLVMLGGISLIQKPFTSRLGKIYSTTELHL